MYVKQSLKLWIDSPLRNSWLGKQWRDDPTLHSRSIDPPVVFCGALIVIAGSFPAAWVPLLPWAGNDGAAPATICGEASPVTFSLLPKTESVSYLSPLSSCAFSRLVVTDSNVLVKADSNLLIELHKGEFLLHSANVQALALLVMWEIMKAIMEWSVEKACGVNSKWIE